jgi:hypothetical protein
MYSLTKASKQTFCIIFYGRKVSTITISMVIFVCLRKLSRYWTFKNSLNSCDILSSLATMLLNYSLILKLKLGIIFSIFGTIYGIHDSSFDRPFSEERS